MHSIERYGIVALLFLVVTVVAVLMWDGGKDAKGKPADRPGTDTALASPAQRGRALDTPSTGPGPRSRREQRNEGERLRQQREDERSLQLFAETQAGAPLALGGNEGSPSAGMESGSQGATPVQDFREPDPPTRVPETFHEEPAPEEHVARSAPASPHTYTVRSGDTLSEIAQAQLGSSRRWREILALNPKLDPARLLVGDQIALPGDGVAAKEPVTAASAPRTAQEEPRKGEPEAAAKHVTWKVANGESLWTIAEKALGDGKRWREIAKLNPKIDPDRLRPGLVLLLPAGSRAGGASQGDSTPRVTAAPGSDEPLVASREAGRDSRRGRKVK